MKEKSFRAGIIGCGGIAAEHIAAYQQNNVEITALTDISKDALENAAEKAKGAKLFDDYKAMLDSGLVDVVSICTPPVAHEEAAVAALERGIHVLCENLSRIRLPQEKHWPRLKIRRRPYDGVQASFYTREPEDEGIAGCRRNRQARLFPEFFGGPAFSMKDKWFSKNLWRAARFDGHGHSLG